MYDLIPGAECVILYLAMTILQAEERRSARLGRDDDARAEMEELRHQEEKKRKKKKAKSNGLM